MQTTNTLIIGGGQAGLAMSRCLTELGRDHLVLERGRVAERWRSERWDSLRLLTPNWMTRLPGHTYAGDDPDGFMTAADAATLLDDYAASFEAPVITETTVERVAACGDWFLVETDHGPYRARNVVIATGWCDRPAVPTSAGRLSSAVQQIDPNRYKRPADVPDGGVLVVGASATGVQLAEELRFSGHDVTLAVGNHSRMPRTYRGMDTFWWLDTIGSFDRTIDDVADALAARREPALQLVGREDRRTLDLCTLQDIGITLVGRLQDVDGTRVAFSGDLAEVVAGADRRMTAVLDRIDAAIGRLGLTAEVLDVDRPTTLRPVRPVRSFDLRAVGIRSIIWATGYRRAYDWLDLPVRDRAGEIAQYRGVTDVPGVYVLGQRFQHFRNSNFIDGVGRDARYLAKHICHGDHRRASAGSIPRQKRVVS